MPRSTAQPQRHHPFEINSFSILDLSKLFIYIPVWLFDFDANLVLSIVNSFSKSILFILREKIADYLSLFTYKQIISVWDKDKYDKERKYLINVNKEIAELRIKKDVIEKEDEKEDETTSSESNSGSSLGSSSGSSSGSVSNTTPTAPAQTTLVSLKLQKQT